MLCCNVAEKAHYTGYFAIPKTKSILPFLLAVVLAVLALV